MSALSSPRPRIALVGVSGYAQIYVDLLLEEHNAARCELAATTVIPIDQDHPNAALLRERGVRLYDSFEGMIAAEAGKIDLCIIPTGIHWHARMTIAALQAGAHVLVEKPLAGSLEDGEAMIAAARETNRWIAVGFQDTYAEEFLWLRKQLTAGAIGSIRDVRVIGLWPRSVAYYNRNQWAGRLFIDGAAALDSPLNNAFAHFINLAIYLAGSDHPGEDTITVDAAELFRAHDIQSFDTAVVQARNARNVRFWFGVSHACDVYREPEIVIQGEHGTAAWYHERHCFVAPAGGAPIERPVPTYEKARQCMFDAVLARFADGSHPICGAEVALRHTRFIHELHRDCTILPLTTAEVEMRRIEGHANEVPSIRHLPQLLDEAMQAGALLSDVGFVPAAAARS